MFHRAPAPQEDNKNATEEAQGQPRVSVPAARTPYTSPYTAAARARQADAQDQDEESQDVGSATGESGRCLVVGRGITLSGEIGDCEHIVIEGTVEAALRGARVLEITESGTFYGSVEINEATVAGRFEGDIIVDGTLRVLATGAITGSLSCRTLEVEAGALIDGRISPLGRETDKAQATQQAAKQTPAKQAPAKKVPAVRDAQANGKAAAQTAANAPAAAAPAAAPENQLFAASVAVGA